jgi:hypothetical protein
LLTPPDSLSISVIESISDAEFAVTEILKLTEKVPFIGLDCEWVGNNSTALLQLAVFSDSGTKCYLFRLQKFDDKIFELLNNILNENSIIKLGVGIDGDYKRLLAEGFVDVTKYSFLDLRFLAVQRVG